MRSRRRRTPARRWLCERVEQGPQHLILGADHIGAGLGEHQRLIQVHEGTGDIWTVGIGDLLRVLAQSLAAGGDCREPAALRTGKAG